MKAVILSYFHPIYGPKVLFEIPKVFSEKQTSNVAKLIDTSFEKGYFIHKFPDFISTNYFFEIASPWARGNKEMVLISILFNTNYEANLFMYETPLVEFVNNFTNVEHIYQCFYFNEVSKLKYKDSITQKYIEAQNLVQALYNVLPAETVSIQRTAAKLFIFGLDRVGKTTLLNRIKHNIFVRTSPTINVNILQILMNNLEIVCFDVAGQKQFRNSWRTFLSGSNGLIFVVDSSDPARLDEARKELWRVLEYEEADGLPLLILSNKIDLENHVPLTEIKNALHLEEIENHDHLLLETSALNNIGVQEGFSWISKQILTLWSNAL
ncbi:MAG: ADP-ribosylation factor family protein [Candidatus Helarchaeota archaeon]